MKDKVTGILALTLLFSASAWSQEAAEEALPPGADDAELMPALSSAELEALDDNEPMPALSAADLEAIDSGNSETAVQVAQGVTRQQGTAGVMDTLDLGRTEITGNQELPKVLYIVPWQKSGPAELMGKPVNTLLDEVLAPIDRTEFARQVEYYDELYRPDEE